MNLPLETVVFLAYLDSLFSESGLVTEVTPVRTLPETLNRLHAGAMRQHARASALLARENAAWVATPDWRFDRQIIRLGLYLRERLDVSPGQRLALFSELRPEWLIADLAGLGLGGVSVAIDPRLQGDDLASALEDAAPSITFVSASTQHLLLSLDGGVPSHGQVITLDAAPTRDDFLQLPALMEMANTLDTPERAQSYRAAARELTPDRPAIRHYGETPGGGWDPVQLSQGEVIERIRAAWLRERARPGDLAYVCDPTFSLATRLALYSFLGDGYTTTALALAGPRLSDLAELHPTKIIAPAAFLAEAVRAGVACAEESRRNGGWLRRVARLSQPGQVRTSRRTIREALGGRARWIGSTDQLDATVAERLGSIAVVGPLPN